MAIQVKFKSPDLQDKFENSKGAIRAWGEVVGKNYIKRVRALQAAMRFEDLEKLPQLNFHPLKGNRKGQYAVNLSGRARLIVTREGEDTLIVQEVNLDHYGD